MPPTGSRLLLVDISRLGLVFTGITDAIGATIRTSLLVRWMHVVSHWNYDDVDLHTMRHTFFPENSSHEIDLRSVTDIPSTRDRLLVGPPRSCTSAGSVGNARWLQPSIGTRMHSQRAYRFRYEATGDERPDMTRKRRWPVEHVVYQRLGSC